MLLSINSLKEHPETAIALSLHLTFFFSLLLKSSPIYTPDICTSASMNLVQGSQACVRLSFFFSLLVNADALHLVHLLVDFVTF